MIIPRELRMILNLQWFRLRMLRRHILDDLLLSQLACLVDELNIIVGSLKEFQIIRRRLEIAAMNLLPMLPAGKCVDEFDERKRKWASRCRLILIPDFDFDHIASTVSAISSTKSFAIPMPLACPILACSDQACTISFELN